MSRPSRFRAGDQVEVRSEAEILATLDERGMLEGMPFMPEMLQYCGRRFRVGQVAHKTCDTIHYSGIRRVSTAVHLEDLRCDGSAHGGCDADCLFFWKDAWLKRTGERGGEPSAAGGTRGPGCSRAGCTREKLLEHTRRPDGERYTCQVTELLNMSRPWSRWSPAQYIADVRTGNYRAARVIRVLLLAALRRLIQRFPQRGILVRTYDRIAAAGGMPRFFSRGELFGTIPRGSPTPSGGEELRAGDWVRVRSAEAIVATLSRGRNRGLYFDTEMFPYCGGTFRVRGRVSRLIEESTGQMIEVKSPCVKLEGVICKSEYSEQRYMCPRAIMSYWRPLWLEKVDRAAATPSEGKG